MNKRILVLFFAVLFIAGCASSKDDDTPAFQRVVDSDLVSQSYAAAEALLKQVPWLKENRQPLLQGTFVNVDNMEDSSAMGRIVAEQVSSRFAQEGFTVIEMKLRRNVYIQQFGGEFVLSREVQNLSQVHNAAAVIAGTYAVGRRTVYINARLIRAADNLVLAAHDYSMPLGPDAKALLASE